MEETEAAIIRTLTRCAATVLSVVILSITSCEMNTDRLVSNDIAHGAKPIEAMCAHNPDTSKEACLVLAGR